MRLEFINATNHRNDIELFQFDPETPFFGKGGARIESVWLTDRNGRLLSWVVGGEEVRLLIRCKANKNLFSPIIGFYVNDRLGQHVFGDNTYLTYMERPLSVERVIYLKDSFSSGCRYYRLAIIA